MPLLHENVVVDTARAPYDVATKTTGKHQPYLQDVPGHMKPNRGETHLQIVNAAALMSDYVLTVDADVDIGENDWIVAARDDDGNSYPPTIPAYGMAGSNNWYWQVTYVASPRAFALEHQLVFLKLVRGSGPSHGAGPLTPNA